MSFRQAGRDSKRASMENPPVAGQSIATRLLLPAADHDARAVLLGPVHSLGAGHSVRDQVFEVERYSLECEGFARHQFGRTSQSARGSAIEAREESCFPDKRGHGCSPGAPFGLVRPITRFGPVVEIDGGGSRGNQEKGKVRTGGQRYAGVIRNPDEVTMCLVEGRGVGQGREQGVRFEISKEHGVPMQTYPSRPHRSYRPGRSAQRQGGAACPVPAGAAVCIEANDPRSRFPALRSLRVSYNLLFV